MSKGFTHLCRGNVYRRGITMRCNRSTFQRFCKPCSTAINERRNRLLGPIVEWTSADDTQAPTERYGLDGEMGDLDGEMGDEFGGEMGDEFGGEMGDEFDGEMGGEKLEVDQDQLSELFNAVENGDLTAEQALDQCCGDEDLDDEDLEGEDLDDEDLDDEDFEGDMGASEEGEFGECMESVTRIARMLTEDPDVFNDGIGDVVKGGFRKLGNWVRHGGKSDEQRTSDIHWDEHKPKIEADGSAWIGAWKDSCIHCKEDWEDEQDAAQEARHAAAVRPSRAQQDASAWLQAQDRDEADELVHAQALAKKLEMRRKRGQDPDGDWLDRHKEELAKQTRQARRDQRDKPAKYTP